MIDLKKMEADIVSKNMKFKSRSAEAGFEQVREQDSFSAEFAEEVACYLQEKMVRLEKSRATESLFYDAYLVVEACKGPADPYKIQTILTTYWGCDIPLRSLA